MRINQATKKQEREARHYVRNALLNLCGFAPDLRAINVHELWCWDDGSPQFVRFDVSGHTYQYDGETMEAV